jgi:hypothetical protein
LRELLAGAVDYAGLYPPASVDMRTAVANYAEYRASDSSWMLGRFVLPISSLGSFRDELAALDPRSGDGWRLSAVLGDDPPIDIERAHAFNESGKTGARIDSVEARITDVRAVARLAAAAKDLDVFVEVPSAVDPSSMLAAIREHGVYAKIRTGGTTVDAFPRTQSVARFIRRCVEARVPFKATAGLHHPLRAEYRLTYQPDAPCGTMFGYLNVFLATAFAVAGAADDEIARVLEETDASALGANDQRLAWRDRDLSGNDLREARQWIRSFGSCSFREPIDELSALALAS